MVASGSTTDSGNVTTLGVSHAAKKTFSGTANELTVINGVTALGNDKQAFSIKANANDGFDIVLNGINYQFTNSDYNSISKTYSKTLPNGNKITFASARKIGGSSVYKYVDMITAGILYSNLTTASTGFATYGEKTLAMGNAGPTASYSGAAIAVMVKKNNAPGVSALAGTLNLQADFKNNKLTGKIANMDDGNGHSVDGQLDLTNGTIANNTFAANLNGDDKLKAFLNEPIKGNLNGGFYGPNADEVAGIFTLNSNSFVGVGGFSAKK